MALKILHVEKREQLVQASHCEFITRVGVHQRQHFLTVQMVALSKNDVRQYAKRTPSFIKHSPPSVYSVCRLCLSQAAPR